LRFIASNAGRKSAPTARSTLRVQRKRLGSARVRTKRPRRVRKRRKPDLPVLVYLRRNILFFSRFSTRVAVHQVVAWRKENGKA